LVHITTMNHDLRSEKLNAVLVGLLLPKMTNQELDLSLQELSQLVKTLGYKVVGRVTQKRSSSKYASVLGEGKLKELAKWTGGTGTIAASFEAKKNKAALKREEATNEDVEIEDGDLEEGAEDGFEPTEKAHLVIVDTDLSPSQLRNLESALGCTVLDRTGVIIEIFSRHANTRTARLQVEIAKLTYVAPRLRETGGGSERQGGGIGGKGSGESALELDKRRIRDRIKELKAELASIDSEHQIRRARRQQEITVALVGYTNAGKSSLMRAMTGSKVLVANKLFATLDTTVRPLYPETRPKILMSDTVGFIKKLPHDLVASFKSTLEEALHASLLIFVVDSSDPSFRSQIEVTQKVLSEVGATDVRRLVVLNKKDCLNADQIKELGTEFPEALMISTLDANDLKFLREKILTFFETDMVEEDIFVAFTAQGLIGEIRSRMRVLSEAYDENGVRLRVRTTPENLVYINKKLK
jgi:GTP-binding protein HflX